MKAFVQVKPDGEFDTENQYCAWRALNMFGYEVIKFNKNQIPNLELTKEAPCVGGLGVMRSIFKRLEVTHKELNSYPESLKSFLGREIKESTVGQVIQGKQKVFIKPTDEYRKSFAGMVFDPNKISYVLGSIAANDPEHPALVSELIDFKSEYRVAILNGEILDARPYKGDSSLGFDREVVEDMVKVFNNAPVAYCLDVGRVKDGSTKLVEVTDAWSFGSYGLSVQHYGRMLIARWEEMMK